MTKSDRLAATLDQFLEVSPDVEAAAIVSADGLPIASALPVDVQEDRLAAMSAALLTLGEKAAEGLGKGDLAQVFVEGSFGYVVLMAAGAHAVLVAVTSKRAKVGLVLYEMRQSAAQVETVMSEPARETPQAAEPEMETEPTPAPVDEFIPESIAAPPSGPQGGSEASVANWQ